MKKSWLIVFASLGVGYFVLMSRPIQDQFWSVMEFLSPRLSSEMDKEWENKPNKFLLNKLKANNYLYSGTAAEILINRKDKTLVPVFIKLLNSRDIEIVGTAIQALGKIGDVSAIPQLMKFVKMGPEGVHYKTALLALSEMQYVPVIPEIIKLANTNLGNDLRPQDYALMMMRNFQSEKFIEILKKLKETGSDPSIREGAAEILQKIEEGRKVNDPYKK